MKKKILSALAFLFTATTILAGSVQPGKTAPLAKATVPPADQRYYLRGINRDTECDSLKVNAKGVSQLIFTITPAAATSDKGGNNKRNTLVISA